MANDREVLREIWEGKLPVCFTLDADEVYELQQPDPFYVMVPRVSYFPLVIDKVKKHFMRYISNDKNDQDMWLEYDGQPLKWHYPIGVLYDMVTTGGGGGSSDEHNEPLLPWSIILHFQKFPDTQIFRFNSKDLVEAHFRSCLKEADLLKHRNQVYRSMQTKYDNQLWLGLQNDKFDQFWAINHKLMETGAEQDSFKHIPFRCYDLNEGGYRQRLVKPIGESGQKKTLKDLLCETFPEYVLADCPTVRVCTHGMYPPLETPIQWMSEHLSYPDNFLHLCIATHCQ